MNIDKLTHMYRGIETLVGGLRQKMARRKIGLCHVLVGLGVVVPSIAAAETICIENPFGATEVSTGWFSDETSGWQVFQGPFIAGVFRGLYTDDLDLTWSGFSYSYSWGSVESAELIVSDEDIGTKFCPQDMWVSSIRTSGRYSDNIHFKCKDVKKGATKLKWGAGLTLGPFSDEVNVGRFLCPPYQAVRGIGCKDSYCDEMFFVCTGFKQ